MAIEAQDLYQQLLERVKANNKKVYETVGNPAPFTVTYVNSAETAIGFTSRDHAQVPTLKREKKK